MQRELTPQQRADNEVGLKDLNDLYNALGEVMNTVSGRRVISSLFEKYRLFDDPFVENGSKSYYNMGQKSVVIDIRKMIKDGGHYDKLAVMEKESAARTAHLQKEQAKAVEKFSKGGNV